MILIILIALYFIFKPKLDVIVNKDVLLWYKPIGKKKRQYIRLFNLDEWI